MQLSRQSSIPTGMAHGRAQSAAPSRPLARHGAISARCVQKQAMCSLSSCNAQQGRACPVPTSRIDRSSSRSVAWHSSSHQPPTQSTRSVQCSAAGSAAFLPGLPADVVVAVLAAAGALIWVKIFDKLASAGILDQKLSRKLVHSTAGPLFVLTWPFFSDAPMARVLAAAVPCLNMIRLFLVGSGLVSDPGLVKSVSRAGDRDELLKGPLYYVIVLVSATLVFWRTNPAGLIAISMMCGGDGLADIVGRRWGSAKLPWNSSKSWAGSGAMFLGGMSMAAGFVGLYCSLGYFECLQLQVMAPYIAAVCLLCTVVESLPINQWVDDNLSVPVLAIVSSLLLMPYAAAAAAQAGCATELPPLLLLQGFAA